jgi:hypothetical protein
MIDFPASPTNGQQFTAAGVVWTWDGAKWTASGSGVAYLPLAGGTMTGAMTLAANPAAPLQPATKQYVDALPAAMGDNRIINGNFGVNQRVQVSGTALAAAAYGHDRWKAGAGGCTYTFTAAVPDTTITITAGTLTQIIEAGMIEGGVYTLSWTGTAQARVYQGAPSGAYAASPVITASLPAGTNTVVEFNTGSLVKVKLESGSVATPFNRQSLAKSLADCQRYFINSISPQFQVYATAGQTINTTIVFPVTMRATPTIAFSGTSLGNATGLTATQIGSASCAVYVTVTAAGMGLIITTIAASAEL